MKSRIITLLCAALTVACIAGCAPKEQNDSVSLQMEGSEAVLDEETLDRNASAAEELALQSTMPEGQRGEIQQEIEGTLNDISERAYEHMPEIVESDQVKIQRTPATPDNGATGNFTYDYLGWNTIYLNSENRGCTSCHADLAKLVESMGGEPHTQLANEQGIDVQVRQCIDCHSYCNVLYDKSDNFASIMHSIHGGTNEEFATQGGDCMSCHYVESTGSYDQGQGTDSESQGKFSLWDDVKYDLWRGISSIGSEEVESTFTWDQDYVLPGDQLFNKNFFSDSTGVARKISSHLDSEPEPQSDGIYDSWEIEIVGDVGNSFTMSISEMIEEFGLETDTMTIHCDAGAVGTNLVGNFEIAGINLKKVMEYAQADEGVNILKAYAPNGHFYNSETKLIDAYDAYLVLEVDGEPLPYQAGYPVQLWIGGASAWCNEKQVSTLEFVAADLENSEEFPDWFFNTGLFDESGHSNYKPGIGIFDLKDGQVLDYKSGEAISLSGYAAAFEMPIAAVEFSFDQGATWVTCETPEANPKNWVHWQFDWTPPEQGAYVIQARSVGEDGVATMEPLEFLLNVQDPVNPIDVAAARAKAK